MYTYWNMGWYLKLILSLILEGNYRASTCCYTDAGNYRCEGGTKGTAFATCRGYGTYCEGSDTMENRHFVKVPLCDGSCYGPVPLRVTCPTGHCENGGTCTPVNEEPVCTCAEGYTGPTCSDSVNSE